MKRRCSLVALSALRHTSFAFLFSEIITFLSLLATSLLPPAQTLRYTQETTTHHSFCHQHSNHGAPSRITTISPSTNKPVLTRAAATPSDIKTIGQNAQSAFTAFRKSHLTLQSRAAIIEKALAILESRIDILSREITEQMGRPIAYTPR